MMKTNTRFEDVDTREKGSEYKTIGEILIIVAVMMYIISAFSFLILPFNDSLNVFIFGLVVAGATGIVIYGSFQLKTYYKLNEKTEVDTDFNELIDHESGQNINKTKKIEKQRKDSISSLFSLLATISYLYIGFTYGLWHPGWIVFLLIPVANALYDLFKTRDNY